MKYSALYSAGYKEAAEKKYRYLYQFLAFIVCYFTASEIMAAGVFDVIPTDKSKQYLGIIFGGSVGTVSLGGAANPMLSRMFEKFNFIVVTAGVIILSYIGIVSAINTAREGEAMGKKFSLWVPMRGVFGMLLMLPSPGTGYSLVQMTVIWIVLNGIGAANAVWFTVLDQLARGLPSIGNVSVPILQSALNIAAQGVLQSSVCMYELNSLTQLDLKKNYGPIGVNVSYGNYQTNGAPGNPDSITQSATIKIGVAPPGPAVDQTICGAIYMDTTIYRANAAETGNAFNTASLQQRLQIKVNAFLSMFAALSSTAQTIVSCGSDANCVAGISPGFMTAASDAYRGQIVQLAGGVSMPIGGGGAGGVPSFGSTVQQFSGGMASQFGSQIQQGSTLGQQGTVAGGGPKTVGGTIVGGLGTAAGGIQSAGAAAVGGLAQGAGYVGGGLQGAGVATGQAIVNAWEQAPAPVAITSNQTSALKVFGWIHAGSYYYTLSQQTSQGFGTDDLYVATVAGYPNAFNGDLASPASAPAGWNPELYNQLLNTPNRITFNAGLQNAMSVGTSDQSYSTGSLPALGSGKASTGNELMDRVVNAFSSGIRDPLVDFFKTQISGSGEDPLVAMGRFGWKIMAAGEGLIFAMIALSSFLMLGISAGSCLNPLPWAGETLFSQLFLILFGTTILLWGAGATLGVYLPLVPYIVFTVTAFGWMIAVVEAVVGAPLIALSLVQPSGEELGQIKGALGIIATICLKPVLMIFGFILAGSVMRAGLTMLNFGFVSAINHSVLPTMFNVIATLVLLVFVDTLFVNKSFELIHLLPNRVIRFMGLQPETGGEAEMTKEAKGGFDTGSKASGDMVKGAYESAQKKLAAGDKAREAEGLKERLQPKWMGGGGGGAGLPQPSGAAGGGAKPAGEPGGAPPPPGPAGGGQPPPGPGGAGNPPAP